MQLVTITNTIAYDMASFPFLSKTAVAKPFFSYLLETQPQH